MLVNAVQMRKVEAFGPKRFTPDLDRHTSPALPTASTQQRGRTEASIRGDIGLRCLRSGSACAGCVCRQAHFVRYVRSSGLTFVRQRYDTPVSTTLLSTYQRFR